ncbi:MAG TPA: aminotransferase class I/II-fold pyridoxal phosphate-dependent enzyme [Thermoanaerobaculia bacterium]|nr:aminotransferase class I/II-fold pyridoxal phosphate-dependent enzyme [Thermoanaerobaculia bacterium]
MARLKGAPRLYGEDVNHPPLVAAARRRFESDGVPAAEISVVSGALDGIERVLREHLRPGDRVVVEDPCFTGIADLLATLALTPAGVAVDEEGILPAGLRRVLARPAAALIVTPRAQNPTGAAFSPSRQRTLRSILRTRPNLLLIEDDHAGPVAGAPYATLVEPSRLGWAVVRSVSKSLGPDLRLAVMSSDPITAARVQRRQTLGIRWVSHILQQLAVALWRDRSVAQLLARAEKAYAARREALLRALAAHGIAAQGRSGLNVWVPVPDEASAIQGLLQRGWGVQAGERYRLASPPAIRVTVAALPPGDAARFAKDLASVMAPVGRSSAS